MRLAALALVPALALLSCERVEPAPPDDAAPVAQAAADDPETLGGDLPTYAERLLSNPYVEVSRFELPAGGSVGLKNGAGWVVYALGPAAVSVDGGPGQTWAAGSARAYDAPTRLTNGGDGPASLVFFERWRNALPDRPEGEDLRFPAELTRLNEIDSPAVDVLVADSSVVVARVSLAPGEVLPTHSAFSRVVYALSDYRVERFNSEGFGGASGDVTLERGAGAVGWDTALNYAVENVGDTQLEALLVAYYR